MQKLSVVISAYNEAAIIGSCLKSVSFADEIIVVDNASTDDTSTIAKKHGATIYTRPNNAMLNINKNYGFKKATGDWILNLDADESVEKPLQEEIQSILARESHEYDGYEIPRKNIIFNKWIKHTGWYPDYQVRLFKKGSGRFEEKHVHEKIVLTGEVGKLNGHIIHENYRSISQFLSKMDLYTSNEADQLIKNGYTLKTMDAIYFPKGEFISRYFAQKGYKDGLHGLVLSFLMAFYRLVVFLKIWESQKYEEHSFSLKQAETQIDEVAREAEHWLSKEQGKQSLFGRFRKILRKLI